MTETVTLPNPSIGATSGFLVNLIVTLLVPMFLVESGGDLSFARMAALQTLNAYCARNDEDLISVVQIIAFGFAALMSLSRSMEDGVSVVMMLRLHGNANACNRSAEHNRRALRERRARVTIQPEAVSHPSPDDGYDQTELNVIVASALERTGQAPPAKQVPVPPVVTPAPAPSVASAPVEAPANSVVASTRTLSKAEAADRENKLAWAAGMALVAAQYAADLPNLSPNERRETSLWANALSTCAHELVDGDAGSRPKPGDLDRLMGRSSAKS